MASLFTRIIEREIPADIVYEDELVIAFLDINPVNEGHTLIVTKEEHTDLDTMPTELVGPFFERVQRIAHAVVEGTGADGYNLIMNTKPASGQEIMHVHAHIIPRFEGDGYTHWQGSAYTSDERKHECAQRIRTHLESA